MLTGFPLCTHRFFCGPYAQRSEKQSKQQRKRDRQGGAEEGSEEEEEDDEEEEEGEEEGSSDGGDSGAGRQAGDHCFLVAAQVSYCAAIMWVYCLLLYRFCCNNEARPC